MSKYQYKQAPNVMDYSVFTGVGEEAKDFKVIAKDIPCQEACPAKTNIPGYIEQISLGNYTKAYEMNLEDNVFPGVLGRICTRPCETACRHHWTGVAGAVRICHLKRTASDFSEKEVSLPGSRFAKSGKKAAVIGGGPAGLTAARELMRCGHEVTLFEKEDHLGGMMVDGIPRFRLPINVIRKEIDFIADSGIEVKLNQSIDAEKTAQLSREFDAVVLAVGTVKANEIEIKGLKPEMGISGIEFMRRYNNNEINEMKGNVIVIGGGFTAVDCSRASARAAKKLVGEGGNVSIVYRRGERQMAAPIDEMEEIRHENIDVRTLASPVSVRVENGRIMGVTFIRNKMSTSGESGKPKITPVPGSEYEELCDHLIIAIGQQQDYSILPEGLKIQDGFATSWKNVFAVGDFLTGSLDVINAVGAAKTLAEEIDTFLMNEKRISKGVDLQLIKNDGETGRLRDHDLQRSKPMSLNPLRERAVQNKEVELGFNKTEAFEHATRCYFCSYKFEIDHDKCIHCNWCIEVSPRECISQVSRIFTDSDGAITGAIETDEPERATYIHIDSNQCIRCGKCLRVCPTEAISMRKATLGSSCQKG